MSSMGTKIWISHYFLHHAFFPYFSIILKCEIYSEITSLPKIYVRLHLVCRPKSDYIIFGFIEYNKVMRGDMELAEILSFTVRCHTQEFFKIHGISISLTFDPPWSIQSHAVLSVVAVICCCGVWEKWDPSALSIKIETWSQTYRLPEL